MKTIACPADVAFSDDEMPPTNEQVATTVGQEAWPAIAKVMQWLESSHPQLEREWKFSRAAGWYETSTLKGRRVFYFIPKNGGFLINLLLGDKAIDSISAGPFARRFSAHLKTAKRYPEGTLFEFTPKTFDAEMFTALLRAKLGH